MTLTTKQATKNLIEAGCENVVKEDRYGETKRGWFQDDCFLSGNPIEAWRLLNGD